MKQNKLIRQIQVLLKERKELIKENKNTKHVDSQIKKLREEYLLLEDTSATGGPSGAVMGSSIGSSGVAMANASIAGMGSVVSPQASSLSGSTIGSNFSDHGGKVGSGDVSVPFPVGGKNPMYQKVPMGKGHGARTGKKSRRLSLGQLRNIFSKKQDYTVGAEKGIASRKTQKVMNWDNFVKDDLTKIKRNKY